MSNPLLRVLHLDVYRAESHILQNLSFYIEAGECVALIGANGSGKSTLIETLMGFHRPKNGAIEFNGLELSSIPAHHLSARGIAWVPEGRRLFADMTVIENIELGLNAKRDANHLKKIYSLFPVLESRLEQMAGTLSGGEQQMVALARALVSKPKIMLIDEMSIGLSPKFTQSVFKVLDEIRKTGVSILLVEQNAVLALNHSERAYVIEQGRITFEGDSKKLLSSSLIKKAYLGLMD